MQHEKIYLRSGDDSVFLETYVYERGMGESDALLVIPGGGYRFVSDREGEPIARGFAPYGFNCFVLTYSIGEAAKYPRPLVDAALAMKYIRENAARFHIRPERVFAVGFSAGGHLCGMLGTRWHEEWLADAVGCSSEALCPTGVMLIYPVLSSGEFTHKDSIRAILGDDPTEEELNAVSVDKCVDSRSAPAFFMHTAPDNCVPVENTLLTAMAYSKAKKPFEMHVFPFGPHGIALANRDTAAGNSILMDASVEEWIRLAAIWTKRF